MLVAIAALYAFSSTRNSGRHVQGVSLHFTDGGPRYISKEMVDKLLIQNGDSLHSKRKDGVDLKRLEAALNSNGMIQEAQVYLTVDGQLGVSITQRTPIARVTDEDDFYMDLEGERMPLSPLFSARVPWVVTEGRKYNEAEVYNLAKYVYKDDLLRRMITEIHPQDHGYGLKIRGTGLSIELGKVERLEEKFNNFKAFYQKVSKDNKLNAYKTINLKFHGQVVCTRE